MQVGDTTEQARQAIADYDVEIYKNLYQPLTPVMPFTSDDPVPSVSDFGLWMHGTIDEVRQQFVRQWEELPAEYVVLIFHYAQQPLESVLRNMRLFMEHVKPALDELTTYAPVLAYPPGRRYRGVGAVQRGRIVDDDHRIAPPTFRARGSARRAHLLYRKADGSPFELAL